LVGTIGSIQHIIFLLPVTLVRVDWRVSCFRNSPEVNVSPIFDQHHLRLSIFAARNEPFARIVYNKKCLVHSLPCLENR